MTRFPSQKVPFAAVFLAAAAVACGGKGIVEPRTPTTLEVIGGGGQSGGVGAALPVRITIRTSDAQGPLGGVVVTSAAGAGGGSAAPASVTTGTDGTAQVTWTLGTEIGTQTLTFATAGVAPASVTAQAVTGSAAVVIPLSDPFQFTVVGRAVSVIPRVKVTDAFGNPSPGITVTFQDNTTGTVITGATAITGADGSASLGSWTIGRDAAIYALQARIPGGAFATFQAQGIPATLVVAAGNGQVGNAGTALPVSPAVRAGRDDGTPLPGVAVSFSVTSGGGVIQGTSVLTDQDGIARPTRWVLGITPGLNGALANVVGKDPITFTATGVAAVGASAVAASPTTQSAFFGNFVKNPPSVTVQDAQGHPIAGSVVTFSVLQGDGQITGVSQTTSFDGVARLGSWRLGSATTHVVRAVAGAFPPVDFTATGTTVPASSYTLEVRYIASPTASQRAAFDQAAARWRQVLISGDAPYPINEPAGSSCATIPAINETVPGVVIYADLRPIDGVNGILGQAGPCIVRDDPMYLSALGIMQFDTADLAALETTGRLNDVILHEMGHVLGFGTMWNFLTNQLLTGAGSSDPFFNGVASRGAFLAAAASGTTFTGTPVPVENTGGGGTRDSHWREATVSNEIMTGFLNQGSNPLSAFTATSFRDLGYVVNDAATDPFTFQAFLQSVLSGPPLLLVEGEISGPILVVNRQGQTVMRVARK